jgi:L,D-transpeptidase catalytic domain
LRAVYDGPDHHLKLYSDVGDLLLLCEAHNDSVASNAWRPDAGCPPGHYMLQAPESNDPSQPSTPDNDWVAEGLWFIPLTNIPYHDGIGIHGGGSCVQPNELEPRQGWCPTENCIRLQNEDLAAVAKLITGQTPMPIQVVQSP